MSKTGTRLQDLKHILRGTGSQVTTDYRGGWYVYTPGYTNWVFKGYGRCRAFCYGVREGHKPTARLVKEKKWLQERLDSLGQSGDLEMTHKQPLNENRLAQLECEWRIWQAAKNLTNVTTKEHCFYAAREARGWTAYQALAKLAKPKSK